MERKKKSLIHNACPIILGVDPGYGRMGLAVIEKTNEGERLIYSECFETSNKLSHPKRLLLIGKKIKKTIEKYKPEQVAVETLLWSKNKKTAMQVAEARGVILFESAQKNIPIKEFNPNQVKLAITGFGKSDKKQIICMIQKLVKKTFPKNKKYDDEHDAVAVALTCAATTLSTEKFV